MEYASGRYKDIFEVNNENNIHLLKVTSRATSAES